MNSEARNCQSCKNDFQIQPEDFGFYEKLAVPPPLWCPECRLIRRLAWRNERSLHKGTCAKCGQAIITIFAPDSGVTVYCRPCWWSDDWSALDYGVDFDPTRPFLEQLHELFLRVPAMALYGLYTTIVNSDYTNMVAYLKNCYMVTYSDYCENATYGSFVNHTKDSVDNLMSDHNELCYSTVNCNKCYRALFSEDCEECRNIYFSKNCTGCSDCFGCVNLRNKRYHIFNKPVSKEEFERFVEEHTQNQETLSAARAKAQNFWLGFPQKYMHGTHNNKVSGDYIFNSKNTFDSYNIADVEDSKFSSFVTPGAMMKDAYDFTNFGLNSSLLYEVMQGGDQASRIRFSWWAITNVYNIEYSMFAVNAKNIFGSVGVRKKEYCILNKQYSKEDYEKLRQTIIDQMSSIPYTDRLGRTYPYGEFFPAEISPFGYNETTAQEFFTLSEDAAAAKGFTWRKTAERNYAITLQPDNLPPIGSVDDAITKEIIACKDAGNCKHQCSMAFRIVPEELAFYRRMNLPLPEICPNCRHGERLLRRNPMKFSSRTCQCGGEVSENKTYQNTAAHFHAADHCPNEFKTSYSPDRSEIVYCEQCYQSEVA